MYWSPIIMAWREPAGSLFKITGNQAIPYFDLWVGIMQISTLPYLINVHGRLLFSENISRVDALIRWWTLINFWQNAKCQMFAFCQIAFCILPKINKRPHWNKRPPWNFSRKLISVHHLMFPYMYYLNCNAMQSTWSNTAYIDAEIGWKTAN